MHSYTFRYYHLDGYLTHRAARQCADLHDALQYALQTAQHDHAVLEILEGETPLWRGTPRQAATAAAKSAA